MARKKTRETKPLKDGFISTFLRVTNTNKVFKDVSENEFKKRVKNLKREKLKKKNG